jgi:hypothetical protein
MAVCGWPCPGCVQAAESLSRQSADVVSRQSGSPAVRQAGSPASRSMGLRTVASAQHFPKLEDRSSGLESGLEPPLKTTRRPLRRPLRKHYRSGAVWDFASAQTGPDHSQTGVQTTPPISGLQLRKRT